VEGLRQLFSQGEDFDIVAVETKPQKAIEKAREHSALLLMDKSFGVRPVTECLKAIRDQAPQAPVVIWGAPLQEAESLRFLQAGAAGVVRKTAPLETLLACLQTVASGGHWIEPRPPSPNGRAHLPELLLTSRELQVVELVELGLRNKDIAVKLGICTGTVKIHLRHIFEKTGIHGRYGLALSCLQQKGLLSVPLLEA
jgi:DNA-binding NarL/FixJ family response regulator